MSFLFHKAAWKFKMYRIYWFNLTGLKNIFIWWSITLKEQNSLKKKHLAHHYSLTFYQNTSETDDIQRHICISDIAIFMCSHKNNYSTPSEEIISITVVSSCFSWSMIKKLRFSEQLRKHALQLLMKTNELFECLISPLLLLHSASLFISSISIAPGCQSNPSRETILTSDHVQSRPVPLYSSLGTTKMRVLFN
jgi:hypothetical protein